MQCDCSTAYGDREGLEKFGGFYRLQVGPTQIRTTRGISFRAIIGSNGSEVKVGAL